MSKGQKSFLISNYFKCKKIKQTKTKAGRRMEIINIKAKSKKIENIKIVRKSMKQKIGSLNTSPKLTNGWTRGKKKRKDSKY